MKMYLYITICGLALMATCALGRLLYNVGYNAGKETVPEIRIDETKAYDLGWKEGRSIHIGVWDCPNPLEKIDRGDD
jgi:hypothetical protein